MHAIDADHKQALQQARRAIDGALTRDRGRLQGLWSRWQGKPQDPAAQAAFTAALTRSVSTREARAASLPRAVADPVLPIAGEADRIVELIRKHPVVVIAGETGSGKTTQLPKLCLAAGRGAAGMIGCTQPRRIAARTVARRVAEELQAPLGGLVGYQVRFNDNVGDDTVVKFMTDGILLAEIQSDRWLSAYDTLIIDEAHERSLNIDFLLGYLKQLLQKRRDLKIIVTSATIDTARFAEHFDNAPVVDVEGRGYPVETRYRPLVLLPFEGLRAQDERSILRQAQDERSHGAARGEIVEPRSQGERNSGGGGEVSVLDGILAACDELTREDALGDALVFLPGEREIRDAHLALERRKYRHTEIVPLYARLSARDQDRVFNPGTKRRIVLATNVAETSLTVPRIRYVVDPGYARIKRYSPRQKLDRLHIEPISQASANQRQGRCGRIAAGTCYRLYSEADFLSRPLYTDPEIRRAALAGVILRMLSLGLGRIEEFPFLEPPDPRAVADGWQHLGELGAVDADRKLTVIGRTMARLPVDVKLARMLVAAHAHGCLHEMLAIASFLGIQDPRERPSDQRAAADNAHAEFADAKSEFVGILKLWEAYRIAHEELTQSKLRAWAEKHFLGFLRLREWRELHRQLKLQCEELGWDSVRRTVEDASNRKTDARRIPASSFPRRRESKDVLPLPTTSMDPRLRGDDDKGSIVERRVGLDPPAFDSSLANQKAAGQDPPYAKLHRALLAGLPTQIGQRTDRSYDGPRGRKFQLFPGSALAKKPPTWVLSATLLDTERVWALTNAAIEPDWAITELPHLLARRQHDPRWSRSQGRVIGSEQISLFGLVLAPKRPIHYGALFPQESRDIFVRDALLTGEINTRSVFVARNLAMLEKAKDEEAKQRRAGLVVDEDWQAQWYLDRLPPHAHNTQALDAWFGKLPPAEKKALEWRREDLLVGDSSDAQRFPAYLPLGDARLAVRYRFEPGAVDDGMTVVVPLHLLNALDAARLSWLAPGFVQDKATALIKTLPKSLRRNFVPAPDFARAFAEAHAFDQTFAQPQADALENVLARFLHKATSVALPPTEFEVDAVEPHLRANLRLLDRDNTVLAESRDLADLRERFGARAADAFAERAAGDLAAAGLTAFPEQPIPVSVAGAGGIAAYPALDDVGDSATLTVYADRDEAHRRHPLGVRRLLHIALADKLKHARKQLPIQAKTALLHATLESPLILSFSKDAPRKDAIGGKDADRLRADLVDGAFDALTANGLADVRDNHAFAERRDTIGKQVSGEAMQRLDKAQTILGLVAEVRAKLDSPLIGWASGNLDDMRTQLAELTPPGFLRDLPADVLDDYPRYLKALALRGERALRDPVKDQARMLEIKPFADALRRLEDQRTTPGWQALRWDLEELRVSLFAQELGARSGVSPKRFAARLAALREG